MLMNICRRRSTPLALVTLVLPAFSALAATPPAREIGASIEPALPAFEAPGVAVAGVHDDEFAFAAGEPDAGEERPR